MTDSGKVIISRESLRLIEAILFTVNKYCYDWPIMETVYELEEWLKMDKDFRPGAWLVKADGQRVAGYVRVIERE